MGKYFGHKPAWARPKPTGFSQGGPLEAPRGPNPYNKSQPRSGQIIPPNRGQYPRGSSLPGFKTPRSPVTPWGQALRAARMSMLMKGLLGGPLNWTMLLGDFIYGEPWVTTTAFVFTPTGWKKCAAPAWDGLCGAKPTPDNQKTANGIVGDCANMGSCPKNQAIGGAVPINTAVPAADEVLWFLRARATPGRYDITDNFIRTIPGVAGAPSPKYNDPQTRPLPQTWTPPWPYIKEKSQPKPRSKPGVRLKPYEVPAHVWGPTLPPKGVDFPHPLQPPPLNTREKKVMVVGGKLGKAAGALTEFDDFLDCLAAAIPGQPCKGMKMVQKVACVARHEPQINMPEAIACFYGEQARDAAHGLPDRMGRPRDNPYYKRPLGPSSGFGYHPRAPSMTPI